MIGKDIWKRLEMARILSPAMSDEERKDAIRHAGPYKLMRIRGIGEEKAYILLHYAGWKISREELHEVYDKLKEHTDFDEVKASKQHFHKEFDMKISDVEILKRSFIGTTDFYWMYTKDSLFHKKEKLTDDVIKQHIEGQVTIGTSPFVDKRRVRYGAIDIDVHTDKMTDKEAEEAKNRASEDSQKIYNELKNDGYAVIINSSGSKGVHIRVLSPKPVDAEIMRAFLARTQIKLFGDIKHEIFPKQNELTDERPYGNQMKLVFGIHPKTGNRGNVILDGDMLSVRESLDYIKKVLENISSYQEIKCSEDDKSILEKKIPDFDMTEVEVPPFCPFIENIAAKILLPSGHKTRNHFLDPNVHAYTLNKPAVREEYKNAQGKNEQALIYWQNYWKDNKSVFNCLQIRSYLKAYPSNDVCKAGLDECEKCRYYLNFFKNQQKVELPKVIQDMEPSAEQAKKFKRFLEIVQEDD